MLSCNQLNHISKATCTIIRQKLTNSHSYETLYIQVWLFHNLSIIHLLTNLSFKTLSSLYKLQCYVLRVDVSFAVTSPPCSTVDIHCTASDIICSARSEILRTQFSGRIPPILSKLLKKVIEKWCVITDYYVYSDIKRLNQTEHVF